MALFSKPQVTILKESSDSKEYLTRLEALYNSERGNAAFKKKIDREMQYIKAGMKGEENLLFELKNSGMDLFVLHDIYLESGGLSAQIDFFVITPQINFIIECKNLFGDIEINSKGDFIRTIEYGGRKHKEGIYSPITQNERHLLVVKNKKLEDAGIIKQISINKYFDTYHKSLVVLANPKTVLNDKYAKKEVKNQVIRADQLAATMKRMCRESKESARSRKAMEEVAVKWLGYHIEQRKDYLKKYEELLEELENYPNKAETKKPVIRKNEAVKENIIPKENKASDEKEIVPHKETESEETCEVETATHSCPRCGQDLIIREGKFGRFYGCSRFPKCRYTEKIITEEK